MPRDAGIVDPYTLFPKSTEWLPTSIACCSWDGRKACQSVHRGLKLMRAFFSSTKTATSDVKLPVCSNMFNMMGHVTRA